MAALHVNSTGNGSPLIMLHGWGMHGSIWDSAAEQLAQHCRVHCVDMPGYGHSRGQKTEDRRQEKRHGELLDEIVDSLSAHFAAPITVCGWSLGGQVALRWAQLHPAQVKKLVLVATTPCFVQRADWRCAMAEEVLQEFANALTQNYPLTLKRFIALQVRGSENERELLQMLRERMANSGEPDMEALQGGLEILRDTDLRRELAQIVQATLVIAGERDTLTPLAASAYLAQALPNAYLASIAGAAHAPFLSHPQIFVEHITSFFT